MTDIPTLLEAPDASVAVVGATDNPTKYGYVIYRDLKRKGYTVFPVNSNRSEVDGDPAFASLDALAAPPTIVNIVVPPSTTLDIVKQCLELGLDNIWLQPGTESPESLAFLQEHGMNYLANACIMIQSR